MKVFKVNKKQVIGVVLFSLLVIGLLIISAIFSSMDKAYSGGLFFGMANGAVYPLILGITRLNREKPAIEIIEIEEVIENETHGEV